MRAARISAGVAGDGQDTFAPWRVSEAENGKEGDRQKRRGAEERTPAPGGAKYV